MNKVSKLIPDDVIRALVNNDNLSAYIGKMSGASTAQALAIISEAMITPDVAVIVNRFTIDENRNIFRVINNIISTLNYRCFEFTVKNDTFTVTYSPWRKESFEHLVKEI